MYDTYGKDGLSNGGSRHTKHDFSTFNSPFIFRDPESVFREFFGSDPFSSFFGGGGMNGSHGRSNGHANSVNNHHSDPFFDPLRTFDIFNAGFDSSFGPFANSSSHNLAGKTGVKRTQTSTRFVNGRKIETKK